MGPGKQPGWLESSGSQPHWPSRHSADTAAYAVPLGSHRVAAALQHELPADGAL